MGRPSKYSNEFRADAVALVRTTEISLTQAGRDLGVNPETLRNWVRQAKIDDGEGPAGALTTRGRDKHSPARAWPGGARPIRAGPRRHAGPRQY